MQNATIDWGDGSPPDTDVTLTQTGHEQFEVIASHTYATSGRYRVVLSGDYAAVPPNQGTLGVQMLLVSTAIIS